MSATKAGRTRHRTRRNPSIRAFTLLELIVTIAIIAVLVSLLGAVIGGGWEVAIDVQCKHHLSQLHKAFYMGRDVAFPSPLYWVGFIESVGCAEVLICPKGDTSKPDPAAPKPRNPYPDVVDDDTPLPPLPPGDSISEQDVEPMRPPASVVFNALESSTAIREFSEQKNFVLPSTVRTNINAPGYYDSFAKMTGGSIGAGTRVNCYFLHFDPVGSTNSTASGRMNFTGEILGVICRDAELDATDSVLGNPGTKYPTGQKSRGFESGAEIVSISSDSRTLTIHRFQSTFPGEQVRVIVRAKADDDPKAGASGGSGAAGPASSWAWDDNSEYDVGGPTSYAMNTRALPSDAWPGQVLLVEYRRTIVDLILDGSSAQEALRLNLAPRHSGRVNALFVDGHVDGLTPEELMPNASGQPWIGSHGDAHAP
jgi:prepilin-type processing-associated H-X9-DG protein/prepilin-type N-terminal cleavage/methylation domain-containing protein